MGCRLKPSVHVTCLQPTEQGAACSAPNSASAPSPSFPTCVWRSSLAAPLASPHPGRGAGGLCPSALALTWCFPGLVSPGFHSIVTGHPLILLFYQPAQEPLGTGMSPAPKASVGGGSSADVSCLLCPTVHQALQACPADHGGHPGGGAGRA